MKRIDLSRRDFTKLTMAAFGGVLAGTTIGCGGGDDAGTDGAPAGGAAPAGSEPTTGSTMREMPGDGETTTEPAGDEVTAVENPLASEPHVCRGLNTCMNKGKSGENACAGQGTCATAEAHTCHTANACKGQGGCGEHPGENACKGKGECAVPLGEDAWTKARASFEKVMKAGGKEVGAAPAA